jgi:hypothetical protein
MHGCGRSSRVADSNAQIELAADGMDKARARLRVPEEELLPLRFNSGPLQLFIRSKSSVATDGIFRCLILSVSQIMS